MKLPRLNRGPDANRVEVMARLAAFMLNKQYANALQALDSVFDTRQPSDWYTKGNILANLHRVAEALVCYDNALRLDSLYVKAWYRKGWIHFGLKQYKIAYDCFMHCTASEDKTPSVHLDLAKAVTVGSWKSSAALSGAIALFAEHNPAYDEQLVKLLIFSRQALILQKIITEEQMPLESIANGKFSDFIKQNWSLILNSVEPKIAVETYSSSK